MQVKSTEFNYKGLQIVSNNDSGLFGVQYEDVLPIAELKLKKEYSHYCDRDSYSLTVERPQPRKVLRSVIIVRSSANCYRVTYADKKGCAMMIAKTLPEVHEFLRPLWAREL